MNPIVQPRLITPPGRTMEREVSLTFYQRSNRLSHCLIETEISQARHQ